MLTSGVIALKCLMIKKRLEGDKMIAVSIFFGLLFIIVVGVILNIYKITEQCLHSYERIDTPNDKKMILVCRRCGKIKKLRK